MKNSTLFIFCCLFSIISCKKDETLNTSTIKIPENTVSNSKGNFTNGDHIVSGTVQLISNQSDSTQKTLYFENFNTEEGPDLYIYLSETKNANNFTNIAKLNKIGNFSLAVPKNIDLTKQKYVLVWCKKFGVLFGSALLK